MSKLKDAECIFHFYQSNDVRLGEEDDICIGVQSREHDMNVALSLKIGKEERLKLMKAFDELYIALEQAVGEKNEQA